VTGPPPQIAARRAQQRAQRRRRRRIGLALTLAVIAAGVAALVALAGPGHPKPRSQAHHAYLAGLYPVRPRDSRHRSSAQAQAEIHRLLAVGLPIYCAGRRGSEVAFTFDDGPGVYTHYALKNLTESHERATFFVVGKSINSWPGWLPRELRLGAIGDHTYTHPDLLGLSLSEVTSQLAQTARLIRTQSGEDVSLWRPPYGASDAAIERIAAGLGLLEIRWSVDSRDWAGADWSQIINIVETGLRPGAIVLMHENHGQTIRALTTLLPYLHRHHLRSVTVPELLASDPPSTEQVRRGIGGCTEPASVLRAEGVGGS
jgi:peptidoglycan/xylan/chitin deacetylase (PgdA/CDA1 family)